MNLGMMRRRESQTSSMYDAEIEYIEKRNDTSTKSAPILSLDINPDERYDCFEITFQCTGSVVEQDRFVNSSNACSEFYANVQRKYSTLINKAAKQFYGAAIDRNKHIVKIDYKNGKCYLDGVERLSFTGGYSNVQGVGIALLRTINYCKIFNFKFWHNETQVCDLNSVRKGNVGYMYDSINEVLHDLDNTINTYVFGADK